MLTTPDPIELSMPRNNEQRCRPVAVLAPPLRPAATLASRKRFHAIFLLVETVDRIEAKRSLEMFHQMRYPLARSSVFDGSSRALFEFVEL